MSTPEFPLNVFADLVLDANQLVGATTYVTGVSGSGKSNTMAVIAEEMIDLGVPVAIVDVQGEHWGLKTGFEAILAGDTTRADLKLEPAEYTVLAEAWLKDRMPVVLDFSGHDDEERDEALMFFLDTAWMIANEVRQPCLLILEEVHELCPQQGFGETKQSKRTKKLLIRYAKQGRKLGIGLVAGTQRSAQVSKDLISQARTMIFHKVTFEIDVAFYKRMITMPGKEIEAALSKMIPGDCFVHVEGLGWFVDHVREQTSFHGGYSPRLGEKHDPLSKVELKAVRQEILDRLKAAKKVALDDEESPYQSRYLKALLENKRREKEVQSLTAQVDVLKRQLDTVSRLSFDPDPLIDALLLGTRKPKTLGPLLSDTTLRHLALSLGERMGWDDEKTRVAFEKVTGVPWDRLRGVTLQAAVRRLERRVQEKARVTA